MAKSTPASVATPTVSSIALASSPVSSCSACSTMKSAGIAVDVHSANSKPRDPPATDRNSASVRSCRTRRSARRAERHLDRQFAASRQRRRQEQAPDIEARARQEQRRRAADDDSDQPDLIARRRIELRVAHWCDPARCVRLVLGAAVGLRIPGGEVARQPSQGVFGSAQAGLGRQPRDDRETAIAARRRELGHRNPHIALAPDLQAPKARRRDADDGVGPACDFEDACPRSTSAPPSCSDNGKLTTAAGRRDAGAGSRIPEWARHAEQREEGVGDGGNARALLTRRRWSRSRPPGRRSRPPPQTRSSRMPPTGSRRRKTDRRWRR